MATGKPDRQPGQSARQRAAAFRAAERKREQRRRNLRWAAVAAAVLAAIGVIVGVVVTSGGGSSPSSKSSDVASGTVTGPAGPEGIVQEQGQLLAPASTAATGQTVDGIQCQSSEQVVYHIHTHLAVYVDGALRPIPAGVGIVTPVAQQTANGPFDEASRCYYWLHTHAQDGIIHIEAPSETTYTLGQFFAIWQQPLSTTQVGPANGPVTAYVNGTRYPGNPSGIPLRSHEDVQLDIGAPTVAPKKVDWSHAQL